MHEKKVRTTRRQEVNYVRLSLSRTQFSSFVTPYIFVNKIFFLLSWRRSTELYFRYVCYLLIRFSVSPGLELYFRCSSNFYENIFFPYMRQQFSHSTFLRAVERHNENVDCVYGRRLSTSQFGTGSSCSFHIHSYSFAAHSGNRKSNCTIVRITFDKREMILSQPNDSFLVANGDKSLEQYLLCRSLLTIDSVTFRTTSWIFCQWLIVTMIVFSRLVC